MTDWPEAVRALPLNAVHTKGEGDWYYPVEAADAAIAALKEMVEARKYPCTEAELEDAIVRAQQAEAELERMKLWETRFRMAFRNQSDVAFDQTVLMMDDLAARYEKEKG